MYPVVCGSLYDLEINAIVLFDIFYWKEKMIKKIILITVFVLFAGVLIAGGIRRTTAKTAYDAHIAEDGSQEFAQNGQGQGRGNSGAAQGQNQNGADEEGQRKGQGLGSGGAPQGRNQAKDGDASRPQGNGGGRQGQGGGGQGNGRNVAEAGEEHGLDVEQNQGQGQAGGGRNRQAEPAEAQVTVLVKGTVAQAPSDGVDMIINTGSENVKVGTGPGYLQEQGFEIANEDSVQVAGYWEGDEFKAFTITRLSDGESIVLRDEFGRPMWSGAGRNAGGQGNQGAGRQSAAGTGQKSS